MIYNMQRILTAVVLALAVALIIIGLTLIVLRNPPVSPSCIYGYAGPSCEVNE